MSDLRELERNSIRAFVTQAASEGYLSGRVLDYGCGKQPYRDVVEAAGGTYTPYDAPSFPGNVGTLDTTGDAWGHDFDTVLCTQVVQYVEDVPEFLRRLRIERLAKGGGVLVLTYPTNWPEVEEADLHRFTRAGMGRLLVDAGFTVVMHQRRASVWAERWSSEEFALGYGVVCRA